MQHVAVSKATTEPTRPALETMADIPRAPSTPKVVIWRPSLGYASCSGYRNKGLDGCTRSARRPGKAALLWKPSEIGRAHVLTPVTNALIEGRLLLEKNQYVLSYFTIVQRLQ